MNDIAFKVIIKNDGIDDVIFKTLMLKGEKGEKGDAGGAEIDDSTTSASKTWSSNKIRNEIDAKPVNLSQLGDVDLDSITDGQMLGYNLTAGKWENKTADASTLKYDANTTIKDEIDAKADSAGLSLVAVSGAYNDLSNKPQLADVATSGDYDDLMNKPSIPPAQVNADWNASSGVAEILNKPQFATVATSGSYNDLSNKPTIPVVDQTLNPSSSNAISNSAVANGLSDKVGAWTYNGQYTINGITTNVDWNLIGAIPNGTKELLFGFCVGPNKRTMRYTVVVPYDVFGTYDTFMDYTIGVLRVYCLLHKVNNSTINISQVQDGGGSDITINCYYR